MRRDIEFKTEDGVTLRGWHYAARGVTGPAPTVIMAHGFSATREIFLDSFAEVFAEAGLGVIVYDHRNFGVSDGAPRSHADPWAQINGYRDAITWAQTQGDVDPDRIGVWGSSYSGGHVLVVAALDRRVKCVVSQVPLTWGFESARRLIRGDHWAGLRTAFQGDRAARAGGQPGALIPVTAPEGQPCALPTADTFDFFTRFAAEHETTDVIDKSFLIGIALFSSCAWVTAWRRAGSEVRALPRSLYRRTSFAASVRALLGPCRFQPETKRA